MWFRNDILASPGLFFMLEYGLLPDELAVLAFLGIFLFVGGNACA